MNLVFIRHNLDTTNEILEKLYYERKIAIHYNDIPSINPDDYNSAGSKALIKLHKYCSEGAIVGADYSKVKPGFMIVGKISPGAEIKPEQHGELWYKTVQLLESKEVQYSDYPLLQSVQPRQTTLTGWPSVKEILESIFYNRPIPRKVNNLAPSQLEVLCYEYLYLKEILDVLILPIGRNLKDVDIAGINKSGDNIFAQVTYTIDPEILSEKLKKLKSFKSPSSTLFFFAPQESKIQDIDVNFRSTEVVFKDLNSDTASIYYKMISKMLNDKPNLSL